MWKSCFKVHGLQTLDYCEIISSEIVSYQKFKNITNKRLEAELKEFEPRLKFESRFKHGWFHLKLYSVWAGAKLEPVFDGSVTWFKFFIFCLGYAEI